jgi:hypothetical protein
MLSRSRASRSGPDLGELWPQAGFGLRAEWEVAMIGEDRALAIVVEDGQTPFFPGRR